MSFKFPILAADNDHATQGAVSAPVPSSGPSKALTRLLAGSEGEAGVYRDGNAAWASDWIWDPEMEWIGAPLCRKALMIWRGLSVDDALLVSGGAIPSAARFDIGAFWSLIGYLDLMEPIGEIDGVGPDFRFRVQGTEVARAMGIDMTGRRLSDAPLVGGARDFVLASHAAVARRGRPLFTRHVVDGTPTPMVWHRALLPFLGADGAVSRILVASRIKERVADASVGGARGA